MDKLLDIENISLSFGGIKALTDVSFDVYKNEIRAIIGPNGAGKSSMLNVINGVYKPQKGQVSFKGKYWENITPFKVANLGIARTFQNIALFKGMSVLDNIMTGRSLKMKSNLLEQALYFGKNKKEEDERERKKLEKQKQEEGKERERMVKQKEEEERERERIESERIQKEKGEKE